MPRTISSALLLSATLFLCSTTLAYAGAKPSVADDQISGNAEFWLGYAFLSEGLPATVVDDDGYLALGGDFHLNIPAGGPTNFQLDLASETGFVDNSNDNYTGSVMGGGHFSFRDPSEWLVGAFAGAGNGFNADDDTVTAWVLGAEGQYYLPDWTLYGQLGYMDANDVGTGNNEAFRDAWFGRGVARFFIDSNVKLEAELSYANGENDAPATDMDVWGWGLRYERSLNSMNTSFFVAYEGNHFATDEIGDDGDDELTQHVIKLGLNVAFGVDGQKYIDRHGATLDLPMVTRWAAYGSDVLD